MGPRRSAAGDGGWLALRWIDMPLEVKALLVAATGVAGSFAAGWLLVNRTRLGRIL